MTRIPSLQRNGTLHEVSTIHTGLGEDGMYKFGYLDRLNGLDKLPYWREKPCTHINASEGSFFPPRELTKSDRVYVYDKDLCRILPLQYVEPVVKDGKQNPVKFYKKPSRSATFNSNSR
jgi:scavenger receptor class B, member 1